MSAVGIAVAPDGDDDPYREAVIGAGVNAICAEGGCRLPGERAIKKIDLELANRPVNYVATDHSAILRFVEIGKRKRYIRVSRGNDGVWKLDDLCGCKCL